MIVSVIVPVYNNPRGLKDTMNSLVNQDFRAGDYEIIIVDNGSTDGTVDIAKSYMEKYSNPIWCLVENNIQSSYAARNKGIQAAKGQILAFTDADCVPIQEWVRNGLNKFADLDISMVAGRIEFTYKTNKPNIWEYYDAAGKLKQKNYVDGAGFGATANLFVRKKLFEKYGLFLSSLESGGDYEFGRRLTQAGELLVYAGDTLVYHRARSTFASKLKKSKRVAEGQKQLEEIGLLKHGNLSWRSLIPTIHQPLMKDIPLIFPERMALMLINNFFRYYNFIQRL